ncbi:FtsX-like permease family protein [Dactylosporangium sp. NPDC049140]|uniref:FtsX-like permease family protein n=1 Tax=Dactylosporangium sp. NPDC049140 TaxID=3155647 RepID=UPI0033DA4664
MIGLALRLAVSGGREQLLRLAVTALGVGLGVTLLLLAAVAFPAFRAHEARDGWTDTSARNARPAQDERRTDPLLWRLRDDGYRGQDVLRVDVAALGPAAPHPPGLTRIPGPGELAVSPRMRQLMATAPADQLADRFPGRITATIGDAALRSPDALVVFVGYDPDQLAGHADVIQVRSIEAAPRNAAPTRFGRVVIGLGAAAVVLPILVLIGTATRLGTARREQRLAAMRLVGALPRQIRLIAAVEAAVAAVTGVALGFAAFLAARPFAARVDIDGSGFFVADLRLTWLAAMIVAGGVPVLAVAAALASLRGVQMSPLGVARQSPARRVHWWRLVPLLVGAIGFAVTLPVLTRSQGDGPLWLIAVVMGALILGIVVIGPWITRGVGLLLTTGGRAAGLLAGHRLAASPTTGFRAISGVVVAVFLVTVIGALSASTLAQIPPSGRIVLPPSAVGVQFTDPAGNPLSADRARTLTERIRTVPGVVALLDLRVQPGRDQTTVLTRCGNLRAAGLATCSAPDAVVSLDARGLLSGELGDVRPVPAADLPSLPLAALLVATDTRPQTGDLVRTVIETTVPGDLSDLPWTAGELKAQNHRQLTQMTDISEAILLVTLIIAGCSLAVAVTGGLLERRHPFTLLRLAGMRPRDLSRVLVLETVAPLLGIAAVSVALGLAVAADVLRVNHMPWRLPPAGYWWTLSGGMAIAVIIALAAIAPLRQLTSLDNTRFE